MIFGIFNTCVYHIGSSAFILGSAINKLITFTQPLEILNTWSMAEIYIHILESALQICRQV